MAELEFAEGEPQEETDRKLSLIAVYNRRLDERERRRGLLLDRGLLNVRRAQAADRRRGPAERERLGALRALARYLSQDQFEAWAEGLAVRRWGRTLCCAVLFCMICTLGWFSDFALLAWPRSLPCRALACRL